MKLAGLSRQIALTMMAMAAGLTLLVALMSYVFYFFAIRYWPGWFHEDPTLVPTGLDWIWIAAALLASLGLAAGVAMHLARRILAPLNSVTDSIQRVAQGDLAARAVVGDRSLGEVARLADDFNALVAQLQRGTEDMRFWHAAIAHELRTPVTILRGRLQGLAEGVFTPDEAQFRSLLKQVEGLSRLIEDLRALSLAESGHLPIQLCRVDLSAEVEAVVELCRPALEAAGQRPVLDLQAEWVSCDAARIRQALLALLENARRHAVAGTVRIETRQAKGWACLRVSDEGPGIAPELAETVFHAFRRGHADDDTHAGSGLGLAVVAAIARAHGGEARCSPSAQGGSCFELRWPLPSVADRSGQSP